MKRSARVISALVGLGMIVLLSACAPVLEVLEGEGQSQAPVLWTAQVSRVERYAGPYQGEQGSATVQDGRVLELELSNRAFGGSDRFGGGKFRQPTHAYLL